MMLRENVVGYVDKRFVCIKVKIKPMLVNEVCEVQYKMSQSHGEKECDYRGQRGNRSKHSPVPVGGRIQRQRWKFVIYKDVVERDFHCFPKPVANSLFTHQMLGEVLSTPCGKKIQQKKNNNF